MRVSMRKGTNLDLAFDHLHVELPVGDAAQRPEGKEGRVEQHGELEAHPADEGDPALAPALSARRLEGDRLAANAVQEEVVRLQAAQGVVGAVFGSLMGLKSISRRLFG